MYERRTDKTKQRDLVGLREKQWVIVDKQNRVWPGCITLEKEHE